LIQVIVIELAQVVLSMADIAWIPEPTKQLTAQAIDVDEAIVERKSSADQILGHLVG
jgi:hypothetical protein